ncbi:MAG: hypothetical protein M1564_00070 [Candidatus Marsarchaeota archaeon]|nr:hypothetical protein [Candidatus Marsarchaeota archaeon]MCL5430686.1 hypothetical protein [Candidatus Marsarchaeota archaeon]
MLSKMRVVLPNKRQGLQASLDMMVSYGIALLIIAIALYVVITVGFFNTKSVTSDCIASPGFACTTYTIAPNGTAVFVISQSTGGTLTINGVACATSPNPNGNGPAYGNLGVQSPSQVPVFYPYGVPDSIVMYSGSANTIETNCYIGPDKLASGGLGDSFTGYLWLNYTFSGLPSNINNVEQVASFTTKFT